MKVIMSHPTGNANVRAVAMGFLNEGMLVKFITAIAYFEGSPILKSGIKDANRREFKKSLKPFILTHPLRETIRQIVNRLGLYNFSNNEKSIFGIDAVYKDLDKFVSKKLRQYSNADAVYCYEDGAYYSFKAAKRKGLHCIYDLPIAYWKTARKLLMEEAERWPAWSNTLAGGIHDSEEKLQRKTAELDMADVIVMPSRFVYDSLPDEARKKEIIISHFGTPILPAEYKYSKDREKPLRVLFVGSLSQRKGLADLFAAVKFLNTKKVELVVLGSRVASEKFYLSELQDFTYEMPRPHDEVLKLMDTCDIFCLPSIVEGRALVMQEAMSRGLPVIITSNTGGEDLVIEKKTGFLVPIRSPEAIAEKIDWFLNNRNDLPEMALQAKNHAYGYSWSQYALTITSNLLQTISKHS